MVFLEILFGLTVAEMLITQCVVVPAISACASAAGAYVLVKGIEEPIEHRDHPSSI